MKKILLLSVITLFASVIFAQECDSYFPQEIGKKYEYKDLDKKGKEVSTSVKTVTDKKDIKGGIEVSIKEESKSKDADSTFTMEYTIKCENGVMSMDMESMLMNQEQMQAYEGMDTKVNSEGDLTIPTNAKAGDDLGGGKVTAEVYNQGVKMMALTFTIIDRKVDNIEDVTTDAGTFNCIKITSHIEFKMMITFKMIVTEWYSKDVGMVKSETYNKKGKLQSSTVLSKID